MLDKLEALRTKAKSHHQEHLFAFYDSLSPESRTKLLGQIAELDFDTIDRLIEEFIKGDSHEQLGGQLAPPPVTEIPKTDDARRAEQKALSNGEEALRKGRVACFLVAGGQGTRLGLNGPKGAFKVGPISDRTLFQVHAEKILALRRHYRAAIPWLIMTSDANHDQTVQFFEAHKYFNLGADSIRIFKQGNMPAVGRDGKILMQAKDEIALSPNGHGGSIKALYDSGALAWLQSSGIDTLFYFQVDNVLTYIGDPRFIGAHVQAGSEMSTKVCRKRDWKEKVGVLGLRDGKLGVIEYSDLPESVAKELDANGQLKWWAGNIAIHVLDASFVERLNKGGFKLPWHKAEKAVPCIGPDGKPVALKPGEKNGIKFETFVFDALPAARKTINVETLREDDFSPVKNAEGEDSPQTARKDLSEQYARWLSAAGKLVPRKADGSLDCFIEISPLTSMHGEGLEKAPDVIEPGQRLLL